MEWRNSNPLGTMEQVQISHVGSVAVLRLNRKEKANALSQPMKEALAEAFTAFRFDATVRGVLLVGEGKHFCAGGDLTARRAEQSAADGRDRILASAQWPRALQQLEKPVVAAVQGCAYGAGLSLALGCDLILAADNARFCASFINVGLVPDMGLLYHLPRRVGMGQARWIALSGETVQASEALSIGLVDKLLPPASLFDAALSLTQKLAEGPTYVMGLTKQLLTQSDCSLDRFLELEATYQATALATADHQALVDAFFEKVLHPPLTGR